MAERCDACAVRATINERFSVFGRADVRGGVQVARDGGKLICIKLLSRDFFGMFDREKASEVEAAACTPDSINARCPGCEPVRD